MYIQLIQTKYRIKNNYNGLFSTWAEFDLIYKYTRSKLQYTVFGQSQEWAQLRRPWAHGVRRCSARLSTTYTSTYLPIYTGWTNYEQNAGAVAPRLMHYAGLLLFTSLQSYSYPFDLHGFTLFTQHNTIFIPILNYILIRLKYFTA